MQVCLCRQLLCLFRHHTGCTSSDRSYHPKRSLLGNSNKLCHLRGKPRNLQICHSPWSRLSRHRQPYHSCQLHLSLFLSCQNRACICRYLARSTLLYNLCRRSGLRYKLRILCRVRIAHRRRRRSRERYRSSHQSLVVSLVCLSTVCSFCRHSRSSQLGNLGNSCRCLRRHRSQSLWCSQCHSFRQLVRSCRCRPRLFLSVVSTECMWRTQPRSSRLYNSSIRWLCRCRRCSRWCSL